LLLLFCGSATFAVGLMDPMGITVGVTAMGVTAFLFWVLGGED
jgi:hypothetical protein